MSFFKFVLGKIAVILMYIFRVFPIDQKKIVFSSFTSSKYSDSPMIISERLSSNKEIKRVWILPEGEAHPADIKVVRPKSLASIYELATAKVWVDNSRKNLFVRKRKDQFYIQTWHGGACIKCVEADAEDELSKPYIKAAKNDSKMVNLFLSDSEWGTNNLRSAFWYTGEILKAGLPRTDVFFQSREFFNKKVRAHFGIDEQIHILLYAPTFRKNKSLDCYQIDYAQLKIALTEKFGGEWCVIVRLHPNIASKAKDIPYDDSVLEGTSYPDINELLMASEFLISDYSVCIFDGMYIGLNVLLYTPDLDEYLETNRKTYFDVRNLPTPLAMNMDELVKNIRCFDSEKYAMRRQDFIHQLGYYSDGNATDKVVNCILNEMKLDGDADA